MRRTTTILLIPALALAGAAFAGCGGEDAAEEATAEKIVEEAMEDADADVDIDGEEVTIKGKDGESSFSTSKELPEGWPEEIELPDGAEIQGSTSASADGGTQMMVTASSGDSVEDLAKHFDDVFVDWTSESSNDVPGAGSLSSWTKDGQRANVTIGAGEGSDEASLVVTIGPDPA